MKLELHISLSGKETSNFTDTNNVVTNTLPKPTRTTATEKTMTTSERTYQISFRSLKKDGCYCQFI